MRVLQICFIFIVLLSCFGICIQEISYSQTVGPVYNTNSMESYPTIQEAIDNAISGDTIQVNSSTYQEQVVVNKQLTLIGEDTGEGQPIIDGNGGTGINITASGVTVHGFNVTNSTWGINVTSNNCIVSGNTVNNNTVGGINLDVSSYNNTISGNTANNNIYGICLLGSNNNTISGNMANNNSNYGICLSNSNNNSLIGDTANYNGDIYSHGYGIYLESSSNNNVTLNIASNNTHGGIRFDEYSCNNSMTGNTVDNNSMTAGIELDYLADNNTIIGNEADNNQLGISLNDACNNTVSCNTANNNTQYGIFIFGSSDNNIISGNTANNNSDNGIYIWFNPSNNTISGNTINNNGYGINIYSSNNNILWLNVFQDNGKNAYSDNSYNSWNSTTMLSYVYDGQTYTNYAGNYWSDYAGIDVNRDGIGDTPYVINTTTSEVDYYPMMALPPAPIADFTLNVTSGNAPLTVLFNDTSKGSGISTWQWNFGDGTGNFTEQNLTHTFNEYGIYTVTLTVSNDDGSDTKQMIDYIKVQNATPVVSFMANKTTGNTPLTILFNDTSMGNNITDWQWSFSDGTGNFTTQNLTHVFTDTGVYTVTLTVSNDGGCNTTTITDYITVLPTIPDASFTSNTTSGTAPLTVQFTDASTSNPTTWDWNFGDGTPNSTDQNPNHTYTTPGTYTVTLTASNDGGSDTTTNTITVYETPVASFTSSQSTSLAIQFTDMSSNTPTSWNWNFGDGTPNSTDQNPTHTYTTPGTYTVTLTASNDGGSDTTTNTITVYETPVATFTSNVTSGNAPLTVQFNDTSSNTPTSWNWSFGDGTPNSYVQNATHTYTNPGNYTVTLNATNAGGSDTTAPTYNITVTPISYTINLYTGWNLISLPIVPTDDNLTSIFTPDVLQHVFVIWGYNSSNTSSPWDYYVTAGYPYIQGNLTKLNESYGYWVLCYNNTTLNVTGTTADPNSITKNNGWNLVGNPVTSDRDVQSVYPESFVVWEFDGLTQQFNYWCSAADTPGSIYVQGSLNKIKPGYGYWVLESGG